MYPNEALVVGAQPFAHRGGLLQKYVCLIQTRHRFEPGRWGGFSSKPRTPVSARVWRN